MRSPAASHPAIDMSNKRLGWLIAFALIVGIALWNSVAGAGEVRFVQPYDPVAQPFSSRRLARHPSDLFWARKGQMLTLDYDARVDRGNAELSASSFVVPGTRFKRTISHAGTGEV